MRVHSYSTIEQAVILPECDVGQGCTLVKCIVDRGVKIPPGMQIGVDHDQDRAHGFRVSPNGVVLVTPDMLGTPLHSTR